MWKTRGQRARGARMVSQVLQNLRITNILVFILETGAAGLTGLRGNLFIILSLRGITSHS